MRDNDIEPPSSGLIPGKIEHSASMIVEGRSSHDLVGEFVRLQALDFSKSDDGDMFGNTLLHQAFASDNPNLVLVKEILQKAPSEANIRNQLGRIPLHYALDRSKVDVECFLLLLKVRGR